MDNGANSWLLWQALFETGCLENAGLGKLMNCKVKVIHNF